MSTETQGRDWQSFVATSSSESWPKWAVFFVLAVLPAGLIACSHAQKPKPEDMLEFEPQKQILTEQGYDISVPPGSTVEVVLPALCLNFSKSTPGTDARFSTDLQDASDEVQTLLTIHDEMLRNRNAYQNMMLQIPSLEILGTETHDYVTPSGHEGQLTLPFPEALNEALQYAIWRDDDKFIESYEASMQQMYGKIEEAKNMLHAFKYERFDPSLFDDDAIADIESMKRAGLWETKKAEVVRELEIGIAEFELTLEWMDAIVGLSRLMLRMAAERQPNLG